MSRPRDVAAATAATAAATAPTATAARLLLLLPLLLLLLPYACGCSTKGRGRRKCEGGRIAGSRTSRRHLIVTGADALLGAAAAAGQGVPDRGATTPTARTTVHPAVLEAAPSSAAAASPSSSVPDS